SRRTGSKFNKVILHRLCMSRVNRAPISIAKVVRHTKGQDLSKKIAVVVGRVTDDKRILSLPKGVQIAALGFSEGARARIAKNGGKARTFAQPATLRRTGANTVLLRGAIKAREAYRHFG